MEFMEIVDKICDRDSKYLNKTDLARELMNIVDVPQNAEIIEIPFDLGNQVGIYFTIPNDNHCYCLYAGHLEDDTESIELCIVGKKEMERSISTKEKNFV